MKTPIERYIEFAIENGYDCEHFFRIRKDGRFLYHKNELGNVYQGENLIEAITSKEFIHAMAKGVIKGKWNGEEDEEEIKDFIDTFIGREIYKVTTRQAVAIRDNTLDQFIKQILPSE